MRASDICTTLDDGIAVAAMYLCLLSMLYRRRMSNQRWRTYSRMLLSENMWRAQRYGLSEGLIDFGRGSVVPYTELYDEILELVAEDAIDFDCVVELERGREILERGTSADRQIALYRETLDNGGSEADALRRVVGFLVTETVSGL
jgi:carboxylate-amine ligase